MNDNRSGALDHVLASAGAERLRQGFRAQIVTNRREALRRLNDEKLQFPTLFTVLPDIYHYKLTDALSPRNFAAVTVCVKKLGLYEPFADQAEVQDSETLFQALEWMIRSGLLYDAPGPDRDNYDAVIDYAAALLVVIFEDTTVLKDLAGLIFRRHRRGRLIHDLVWCFFQTLDRDAIAQVAGKLLSTDQRDVALASKLLSLETPPRENRAENGRLRRDYMAWLDENKPYLYVTGEHFQQTSRPRHLNVDPEAKYLGKELSPRYRAPLEALTERELACLHEYRGYPPEEQEILTEYSHRLRRTDAPAWEEWIQKQVAEQVLAARNGGELL